MSYLYVIIGALVLAFIGSIATVIAFVCRPPICPACKSKHIDEYPAHCVCRLCGKQWEEPRRFGSHGGVDL
jgi:hypothetical protein